MVAYYSITAFVTLYITRVFYDCGDDYVEFFISDNESGKRSRKRRSRVRFSDKGAPYFISNQRRIYLDECIKVK